MSIGTANRIEERELIRRLKKQDPSAQRTLYDSYAGYLVAVCSRYIPDDERVKDVLQDSFIQIFRHIGDFEFRGEGSLLGWMKRIVVNKALKDLRRKPSVPLPASLEIPGEPDDDADPGIAGVPVPVLMEMIRKLPDGYRNVFNLYVFEELPHKEIAGILGIKANSSCSQYSRARAILAREIKEYKKKMNV